MSVITDFWSTYGGLLLDDIGPHLYMTGVALLLGMVIALPLGILLSRFPRYAAPVITTVSVFQTIPSLVFFALIIPVLGIGTQPAIAVLVLYSLLPILRNTYIGLSSVDAALIDAARGQGMTPWELLTLVELPLAAPVILTGIRLSATYLVSWATLAALIGAGGLGNLIFAGISSYDPSMLLAGAIPAAVLALVIGLGFGLIRRLVTPRGLKMGGRNS